MKFASAFAALVGATTTLNMIPNLDDPAMELESKWTAWKMQFNKESTGFAAFKENEAIIRAHNAKGLSWTLGHNQFSDLTWEQFKAQGYVGNVWENPALNRTKNYDYSLLDVEVAADSLDWVTKGAVTPVKNQAQCGSCWAFSTTGSIEGGFQIAGNPLTSFSEENLVQCDNAAHGGSDQGCNGGLMDNAFKWVETNGLCTEEDYPYTSGSGATGTCKKTCKPAVTLTGFTDVPGESGMLAAIGKGPVSVAIEADKSAFQLYKGGVLDSAACGKKLDHGVLTVGYGTDATSGKAYYKVKNSWGATWGEQGYLRMVQGKDMCGIADSASYPTGVKPMGPTPPGPSPGPGPGPGPGPAPGPSPYKCAEVKAEDNCDKYPLCTWCSVAGNGGCYSKKDAAELPEDISKCDSGPAPGPGPSPPTPGHTHYGDPSAGCLPDEQSVQVTGVDGDFCSPSCTSAACPTDKPKGASAEPQCALQSSTGTDKNCALICSPTAFIKDQKAADAKCGENASCKSIQTVGICTYDD